MLYPRSKAHEILVSRLDLRALSKANYGLVSPGQKEHIAVFRILRTQERKDKEPQNDSWGVLKSVFS